MSGPAIPFETTECSRCGGSGHYSYCQQYGTVCFKCHGRGTTLTRRGAAAHEIYTASLTRPASDVRVGQMIRVDGLPGVAPTFWLTITEITPDAPSRSRSGDGPWIETPRLRFAGTVKGRADTSVSVATDSVVRVGHSTEEKAPKIAAALAYQETLTKTGTVRKNTRPAHPAGAIDAEEAEMSTTPTEQTARLRAAAQTQFEKADAKKAEKAAKERARRAAKKAEQSTADAIESLQAAPDPEVAVAAEQALAAPTIIEAPSVEPVTPEPVAKASDETIIAALRVGDLSIPAIATKYGSTYGPVKRLAVENGIPIGRARTAAKA